MSIHIESQEWMMTAGLIGFTRLLDEQVKMTRSGVEITADTIQDVASKYIYGLIDEFSVVEREMKRLNRCLSQMRKKPAEIKKHTADMLERIKEQYKRIEKYFPETEQCAAIKTLMKQLKEVTTAEDVDKVEQIVKGYQQAASTPMINEKLTLNYARTVILTPLYGQTSILQLSFNGNTKEHIKQIEKDFVTPAYLELQFYHHIQHTTDPQLIIQFLSQHEAQYKPFKDWLKKIKKCTTVQEIKQYLYEEVLPCSFIDELRATQSYEEKMFSPLALSRIKAANFYWDFDNKQPIPMSAVARLVLFMIPFGMTFYKRKRGNDTSYEIINFASIIMSEQSFPAIYKDNTHYKTLRSSGASFPEAIIGVLEESLDKAKKMNNACTIIEVHSQYPGKKTLLDYYHVPPYLTSYLAKYGKGITLLHQYDLRDTFLREILQGIDPKQVLFQYLREAVKNDQHGQGAYHAVRERRRILNARKDVKQMTSYDKRITFIKNCGVKLRKKMVSRPGNEGEGTYRASGRKKLEGVAYRLINAVKSGNKNGFMDTIFRLYMSADMEIPDIFVDVFKDEGLDFETIASAFIAGMLEKDTTKKEEETANG
ncbi:type I-B CRISPR-associated protein Cas8b1/Cst1 [Longirhabdus pacifica]|uniref:type I-B CRISPR-associated protein Cas8b1/Cst1 n=1 Tax=Longirhabdus pacifica TaxID=2305227 RepID=UPI0010089B8F|nr:type I-B CRISPR-associated protein Cas8b1/Cst1 [Longirhabdus pacifica]